MRTRPSRARCAASTRRSSRAASSPRLAVASTTRSRASSASARKRSARRPPDRGLTPGASQGRAPDVSTADADPASADHLPGGPQVPCQVALRDRLQADVTAAMRSQDALRRDMLRMALTPPTTPRSGSSPLTDDEVLAVLMREVKQRRESVDAYQKAGRDDLAAKETAEIAIIAEFLPTPLTDDELRTMVASRHRRDGCDLCPRHRPRHGLCSHHAPRGAPTARSSAGSWRRSWRRETWPATSTRPDERCWHQA